MLGAIGIPLLLLGFVYVIMQFIKTPPVKSNVSTFVTYSKHDSLRNGTTSNKSKKRKRRNY